MARILMLTQFYPPFLGGEERFVEALSVQLAARGYSVAVATLWREGLPTYAIEGGVRVYRLRGTVQRADWLFSDTERPHMPPFPDPEMVLALREVVHAEAPEIVHAHNWLVHSFLPLKAWSRAKLVLHLHDYSLACAKKKLIYLKQHGDPCQGPRLTKCLGCGADHYGAAKGTPTVLANFAMGAVERRLVDRFVAISRATAAGNGLVDSGLPYEIIPNFLPNDVSADEHHSAYLTQLPGEGFLMFAGALGVYKGVDVLLRAYAGLTDAPPLVLIGYSSAEYPLALGELPGNVFLYQDWPREAVMGAWHRSLAGIIPSIWAETFGLVALEAMLAARPVIASRIGGLADVVIDGETGLLVPPNDEAALRHAIERLLADEGLRTRLGEAGRARAREFAPDMIMPRFEVMYEQLRAPARAHAPGDAGRAAQATQPAGEEGGQRRTITGPIALKKGGRMETVRLGVRYGTNLMAMVAEQEGRKAALIAGGRFVTSEIAKLPRMVGVAVLKRTRPELLQQEPPPLYSPAIVDAVQRLAAPVVPYEIAVGAFWTHVADEGYPRNYAAGPMAKGGGYEQKLLEYFVSLDLLTVRPGDVVIDVASEWSAFPAVVRRRAHATVYQQDLIYPPGVHGDRIGGNAADMHIPDAFADTLVLHNAFEHFEGAADTAFIPEAWRVLKPGGKVCILPLLLTEHFSNVTDPLLNRPGIVWDRGARICPVPGWHNRFGRFYDAAALGRRVLMPAVELGFEAKVFHVTNAKAVHSLAYLHFVLELHKPALAAATE